MFYFIFQNYILLVIIGWYRLKSKSVKTFDIIMSIKSMFFIFRFWWGRGEGCSAAVPTPVGCTPIFHACLTSQKLVFMRQCPTGAKRENRRKTPFCVTKYSKGELCTPLKWQDRIHYGNTSSGRREVVSPFSLARESRNRELPVPILENFTYEKIRIRFVTLSGTWTLWTG